MAPQRSGPILPPILRRQQYKPQEGLVLIHQHKDQDTTCSFKVPSVLAPKLPQYKKIVKPQYFSAENFLQKLRSQKSGNPTSGLREDRKYEWFRGYVVKCR